VGVGAWSPLRSAPCPRGAAAGFSTGARRRRLSPGGGGLSRRVARAAQPATDFRWHMIWDLRSCSTKAAQ
jgi:hypothetical protein